jgi:AcrR family transcriptional regulator
MRYDGRRVPAADDPPRARLLAAVIDHIRRAGFTDLSLRELAAAIGTSHRMLLYHFGSREGLLVAVVRAVEEAQRAFLAELVADPALARDDALRALWRRLADPALWPNERLFFELYAHALRGRPGTAGLLDDIVDAWVRPAVEHARRRGLDPEQARRRGLDPEQARVDARLGVAVVRGLLLDLLATRDRAGVDAAFERFLALHAAADPERPRRGAGRGAAGSARRPRRRRPSGP